MLDEEFYDRILAIGTEPQAKRLEEKVAEAEVNKGNLLEHLDAHPLVLDALLTQKYGMEWFKWAPDTLPIVLGRDFGKVLDVNLAKLNAVKTLHLVDTYWTHWEVFNWMTIALDGSFPDFEVLQVPTVAQCALSATIASYIRTDVPWTSEVKAYVATVFKHDGIFLADPPLQFVKIDAEDYPINVEELTRRWEEARSKTTPPTGDTIVDEQIRRLMAVRDYVTQSNRLMQRQMRFLNV